MLQASEEGSAAGLAKALSDGAQAGFMDSAALFLALRGGHADCAELLRIHGAAASKKHFSTLQAAAFSQNPACVSVALKCGDEPFLGACSEFAYAVHNGPVECAALMLEHVPVTQQARLLSRWKAAAEASKDPAMALAFQAHAEKLSHAKNPSLPGDIPRARVAAG